MLRKEEIEQFYRDVERLDLKFPVAAIARQTSHSKANVSKYLARKLEPSEAFLKAYYEKFPKGSKEVSRETNNHPVIMQPEHMIDYIKLLKEKANSNTLDQKLEKIMEVQIAIMEVLLAIAEEGGKKAAYSKTVAILKKRNLEGIFL